MLSRPDYQWQDRLLFEYVARYLSSLFCLISTHRNTRATIPIQSDGDPLSKYPLKNILIVLEHKIKFHNRVSYLDASENGSNLTVLNK